MLHLLTLKVLYIDILPFSWALSLMTGTTSYHTGDLIVIALLLLLSHLWRLLLRLWLWVVILKTRLGGLIPGIIRVAPTRILCGASPLTSMFQSFELLVGISKVLILWLVARLCGSHFSTIGCCTRATFARRLAFICRSCSKALL